MCDYDVYKTKWNGKYVMDRINLDILELIEKYLGIIAHGPVTYESIISNIQHVVSLAVCTLVDKLKNIFLIKEPGQDVETFGLRVIDNTRQAVGSVSSPKNVTSIVSECVIECDFLNFVFKCLQLYNLVDNKHTGTEWESIV